MKKLHTPVMLRQVVEYLDPAPGKKYLDATLGAAGHTLALLEQGADVVGIDRDAAILSIAEQTIAKAGYIEHFHAVYSSFADALSREPQARYNGILFDLGVSSYQLDTKERGFSFRYHAPLDMRMDQSLAVTAADLVNGLGKKELFALISTLGEDRNARKIVNAIIDARKLHPIKTTTDLVHLVESVVAGHNTRIHPATRLFQALRMAVNLEREELKAALPSALSCLAPGGILAVITFQSLEESIVHDFLVGEGSLAVVTPIPIVPTNSEIKTNPRSRSAKLHVARKQKGE